jgi:hypothetical protein
LFTASVFRSGQMSTVLRQPDSRLATFPPAPPALVYVVDKYLTVTVVACARSDAATAPAAGLGQQAL